MAPLVQIGQRQPIPAAAPRTLSQRVAWLQAITLVWMILECGISLFASVSACSPALLAFGADSLVELLSASVVLLQFIPRFPLSERRAHRSAAILLGLLAGVVVVIALLGILYKRAPEPSRLGMGITFAALVAMPALAWYKRKEARRTHDAVLAADAVQSATCAYLAATTLAGLAANAFFRVAWFDSLAALIAVPILLVEARRAWQGKSCGCC